MNESLHTMISSQRNNPFPNLWKWFLFHWRHKDPPGSLWTPKKTRHKHQHEEMFNPIQKVHYMADITSWPCLLPLEADSSNDSEGVGWSWSQISTVLPTQCWLFHLFPMCAFLPWGNLLILQRYLCGCTIHITDVQANRRKLDLVFISEKDPDKFHGSFF